MWWVRGSNEKSLPRKSRGAASGAATDVMVPPCPFPPWMRLSNPHVRLFMNVWLSSRSRWFPKPVKTTWRKSATPSPFRSFK